MYFFNRDNIYIYISDSDVTFVHLFISVSYLSLFRDA